MALRYASGAKLEAVMIQVKFIVGILTIVVMALIGVDIYYDSSCKKINALSYDGDFSQLRYFPDGIFDSEGDSEQELAAGWYSEELAALREPSLWDVSEVCEAAVYRFLLLRKMDPSVSIRLVMRQDGASTLHVKQIGSTDSALVRERNIEESLRLSESETEEIIWKIRNADFWDRPSGKLDSESQDGSQWIIEGAKGGHYNVVDIKNPRDGPLYEVGLSFLGASRIMIDPNN